MFNEEKVVLTVILFVIAVMASAYMSLLDYTRIVRSAYYQNPYYVFQAVNAEYFTKKEFSRSKAVERVEEIGLIPTGSPPLTVNLLTQSPP